jgi:hypothetical protein
MNTKPFKLAIDLSRFDLTYGEVFGFLESATNAFMDFEDYLTEGPDYDANPESESAKNNPWNPDNGDKCDELAFWIIGFPGDDNPEDCAMFVTRAYAAINADFADWLPSVYEWRKELKSHSL